MRGTDRLKAHSATSRMRSDNIPALSTRHTRANKCSTHGSSIWARPTCPHSHLPRRRSGQAPRTDRYHRRTRRRDKWAGLPGRPRPGATARAVRIPCCRVSLKQASKTNTVNFRMKHPVDSFFFVRIKPDHPFKNKVLKFIKIICTMIYSAQTS